MQYDDHYQAADRATNVERPSQYDESASRTCVTDQHEDTSSSLSSSSGTPDDKIPSAIMTPMLSRNLSVLNMSTTPVTTSDLCVGKHRPPSRDQGKCQLSAYCNSGLLTVHVMKAIFGHQETEFKDLAVYIKVALIPDETRRTVCKTNVVTVSIESCFDFDAKFSYELLDEDLDKSVRVTAWRTHSRSRQSRFLGGVSFDVGIVCGQESPIQGWFTLEKYSSNATQQMKSSTRPADVNNEELALAQHQQLPRSLSSASTTSTMETKLILIYRGRNGFGFSISGQEPVLVCRVDDGSMAQLANLNINDRVLRIDGHNVAKSNSEHVAALVRRAIHKVVLEIQRPITGLNGDSVGPRCRPVRSQRQPAASSQQHRKETSQDDNCRPFRARQTHQVAPQCSKKTFSVQSIGDEYDKQPALVKPLVPPYPFALRQQSSLTSRRQSDGQEQPHQRIVWNDFRCVSVSNSMLCPPEMIDYSLADPTGQDDDDDDEEDSDKENRPTFRRGFRPKARPRRSHRRQAQGSASTNAALKLLPVLKRNNGNDHAASETFDSQSMERHDNWDSEVDNENVEMTSSCSSRRRWLGDDCAAEVNGMMTRRYLGTIDEVTEQSDCSTLTDRVQPRQRRHRNGDKRKDVGENLYENNSSRFGNSPPTVVAMRTALSCSVLDSDAFSTANRSGDGDPTAPDSDDDYPEPRLSSVSAADLSTMAERQPWCSGGMLAFKSHKKRFGIVEMYRQKRQQKQNNRRGEVSVDAAELSLTDASDWMSVTSDCSSTTSVPPIKRQRLSSFRNIIKKGINKLRRT